METMKVDEGVKIKDDGQKLTMEGIYHDKHIHDTMKMLTMK